MVSGQKEATEQAVENPSSQKKERDLHFTVFPVLLEALLLSVYKIVIYASKCNLRFRQ